MKLRDASWGSYSGHLKMVASLSGLFSDSDKPLINYRTAEKLFAIASGAEDVSRKDCSFDSTISLSKAGVGVKTFTANSHKHRSLEKIAEFSKAEYLDVTSKLIGKNLATKVAEFRNRRVTSDALERGLDLNLSYYHCVVRVPGGLVVHEEPYSLINTRTLTPLTNNGKPAKKWPGTKVATLHFTDGQNRYMFHSGKNTLYKDFDLSLHVTTPVLRVAIITDVFAKLMAFFSADSSGPSKQQKSSVPITSNSSATSPDENYVILPLYSTRSHQVAEKSGINQWNAGGRVRTFGESYIPVPAAVHKVAPNFFPSKNEKFELVIPTGKTVTAKICQAGGKALMADPNKDLLEWLYSVIDGNMERAKDRLAKRQPYQYADLVEIGKDCVKVQLLEESPRRYKVEFADLGAYDEFILER